MAHWVCLHANRLFLSLVTTLYPRWLVVRAHTRCLCVVMTSAGSPLTQCKLPSPPGTGSPDAGSRAPVTSIIMFIFIYLECLETFLMLHSALLRLSGIIKSRYDPTIIIKIESFYRKCLSSPKSPQTRMIRQETVSTAMDVTHRRVDYLESSSLIKLSRSHAQTS